jgi:hypothetical protein
MPYYITGDRTEFLYNISKKGDKEGREREREKGGRERRERLREEREERRE